jgi:hypothetical protein
VKKLVISIATASLLLSAGAAFSQTPMVQKDAPIQPAPQTQAAPTGQTKTAPVENKAAPSTKPIAQRGDQGERREQSSERREGHGEYREGRSERRERGGVNIRIGGDREGYRDGYRHHRGYGYAKYGARCRITIVKSYRHGRRVIQRIRRCW